jgi:hypothetical protein
VRQVAVARRLEQGIVRAILCDSAEGVYLFLYKETKDGPCAADELFPSVEEAQERAGDLLGVERADWETIEDVRPGCQDDWIAPVRIKTRADGGTEKFERFESGCWVEVSVGQ